MTRSATRLSAYALGLVLVFCGAGRAAAHPHAWVDLRSSVVLDEAGRVVAIEEEWFFDVYYSVIILDELQADGRSEAEVLDELAASNLESLRPYDYFTDVRLDDERLPLGVVEAWETAFRDGRLWMRFTVPLAEPVDPASGDFRYAIYDPSYYIEYFHFDGEPIMVRDPGNADCGGIKVPPNPTMEEIALAAALDVDQSGGDSLGVMFAEWVEVTCK